MRIAILSDIHEDIEQLEKVFDQIDELGIDLNVCLGDIMGFSNTYYSYESSRDASACLQLTRARCEVVIPGNHDLSACKRVPKHSRVFEYPDDWYEMDIETRNRISGEKLWMHEDDLDPGLGGDELDYLSGLPEFQSLELDGNLIMFSHYAYPNLSGMKKEFYTWKDEFNEHFEMMNDLNCKIAFAGHAHPEGMYRVVKNKISHIPFDKWIKLKKLPVLFTVPAVNREGNRSGFCLLDTEFNELSAVRLK